LRVVEVRLCHRFAFATPHTGSNISGSSAETLKGSASKTQSSATSNVTPAARAAELSRQLSRQTSAMVTMRTLRRGTRGLDAASRIRMLLKASSIDD
jgi:hypothetical protein